MSEHWWQGVGWLVLNMLAVFWNLWAGLYLFSVVGFIVAVFVTFTLGYIYDREKLS